MGGQGAQLFYSDFQIDSDNSAFVSAALPVSQGAAVYRTTITQRRYMWNTVTAAEGVMIPVPSTPTSFTGWSTTTPTQPALLDNQGTQLFYSDFQIDSTNTFVSAATPVAQGDAVYALIYTQVFDLTTGTGGVGVFYGSVANFLLNNQPEAALNDIHPLDTGFPTSAMTGQFRLRNTGTIPSGATGVTTGLLSYLGQFNQNTIFFSSIRVGTVADMRNAFGISVLANGNFILERQAVSKARVQSQDFNTLVAAGNTSPRGIFADDTHMWVVDAQDDKIYAYNKATKARVPSQDFNTLNTAGNTNPRGIFADDTHMWVADSGGIFKIFAYNKATKARVPSQDFNTLNTAGNFPTGIFADDTHMWVADPSNDKIFAYNKATKARVPSQDFNTLNGGG